LRGRAMRGLRDWQPLLIPLLIGGLERSMNLSETMVARGYASGTDVRLGVGSQIGLFIGLVLAFAGWLLTFWLPWAGWSLLTLGLLSMIFVYFRLGRRMPFTKYAQRPWRAADSVVALGSILALMLFVVPLPFVDRASLSYSPYPLLTPPFFDPVLGLAAALLVLPAIVLED